MVVWEATFFCWGFLAYFLGGDYGSFREGSQFGEEKERSWDGQTLSWHDT